jgi:hypothetical protein
LSSVICKKDLAASSKIVKQIKSNSVINNSQIDNDFTGDRDISHVTKLDTAPPRQNKDRKLAILFMSFLKGESYWLPPFLVFTSEIYHI